MKEVEVKGSLEGLLKAIILLGGGIALSWYIKGCDKPEYDWQPYIPKDSSYVQGEK